MGRFSKFWAKTYFGKNVGFNKQLWNFRMLRQRKDYV